jgi:two-component system, sensor histidine kinase RpfC
MNPRVVTLLPAQLRQVLKQLGTRSASELQQSLVLLGLSALFLLYFLAGWLPQAEPASRPSYPLAIGFLLISVWLMAGSLIDTRGSPQRRYARMAGDALVITGVLLAAGEGGAPLAAIYLWVTLGNGFRYGMPYLLAAMLLSLAGFGLVVASVPFWQEHMAWSLGFMLMLAAVPLYSIPLMCQLHNATARAIEASQAKSTFLANMSHELRTPLNGIIGASDLFAETPLDKQQKEFSRIIHSSAHALLELIDKALDISRIEAGHLSTHKEDFDLHRLVKGTIAMMAMQAHRKGLVLAAHIAPQAPFRLHGDARHLRQILINLIGNAVKFTEQGRVDVTIRPLEKGNPQRLRFEVIDSGIGIAEAAQARIFDSFFQADSSITRRYGGTGLGTSIARQLVEALGGRIGVDSRAGEGTTFWFEIPFALQAAKSQDTSAEPFGHPMRVAILAAIEPAVRMQTLIRSWGTRAVVVNSTARLAAELSAQLAASEPIGAVLVERASLPGDPASFLRQLHADPALASLPVILIESDTAADWSQQMTWLRAGYASVLTSPVNSTQLFNAIHAAVIQDTPQYALPAASFQPRAEPTRRLRILVAEDNPVNQRVLRSLLEHAGHETRLAHDGEEALALLQSESPGIDLAIIDMHMPGLSGPQLVTRWRSQESAHLPIIMLTADARDEAERACLDSGADSFLTKPVGKRQLIDEVARLARPASGPTRSDSTPLQAVLDASVLDDLLQLGGLTLIRELIENFSAESEDTLSRIERSLAGSDPEQWHEQLHRLKGSACDVGALRLAASCAAAKGIRPGEPDSQNRFDAVRVSLAEALTALTRYLDSKSFDHRA